MNFKSTIYFRTRQAYSRKNGVTFGTLLSLVFLTACATKPGAPLSILSTANDKETTSISTDAGSLSNQEETTQPLPELLTPSKKPEEFALDLIGLMGTSPGKCGAAAKNTPQVNWTCAEYKNGLRTFMEDWDRLITSAEVSLNHAYTATSDWMYFVVGDEIDFFWKTYDLGQTQVLVAYDPSETGNELIIGLNPDIGSQIAAANGSYSLISLSQWLPVKK